MKQVAERLITVESELARERGPFLFFGLLLRQDSPGRWDIVVAAPWIERSTSDALAEVAGRVHAALAPDQLVLISRVVPAASGSPGLNAVLRAFRVEHGLIEVQSSVFFGLLIQHAFIITCNSQSESPLAGTVVRVQPGRQVFAWEPPYAGRVAFRVSSDVPIRVSLLDQVSRGRMDRGEPWASMVMIAGSETRNFHTWTSSLQKVPYYVVVENPGPEIANVHIAGVPEA